MLLFLLPCLETKRNAIFQCNSYVKRIFPIVWPMDVKESNCNPRLATHGRKRLCYHKTIVRVGMQFHGQNGKDHSTTRQIFFLRVIKNRGLWLDHTFLKGVKPVGVSNTHCASTPAGEKRLTSELLLIVAKPSLLQRGEHKMICHGELSAAKSNQMSYYTHHNNFGTFRRHEWLRSANSGAADREQAK